MCSSTPSAAMCRPEISPELALAFEDMRIAIAIKYGLDPELLDLTVLRGGQCEAEYLDNRDVSKA